MAQNEIIYASFGVLITIIGYFLVNLHNRFEEHLRASAASDKEFSELSGDVKVLRAKQEEQCDRLDRVENKLDDLPHKVIELLKGTK